jgi:PTH1 family peptidyl-tRNA hydrolase
MVGVGASAPAIRMVAGLGNPGPRYAWTRHNAGQLAVELLGSRLGAGRFTARFGGRIADARGPAGPVSLLIPTTYMNDSGGVVRGKLGGGAGGHNGLRSVTRGLGTGEFPRIRMGVGRPPADFRGDGADWVLMRFTEPREEVEAMVARAADMAEVALADGIDAAINRFHASPPGARAKARRERREQPAPEPEEAAAEPGGEP